MPDDLFAQINHAVLDIQSADFQTIERPLKQLARLLDHDDLTEINAELTAGVDLDAFLKESEGTQGSMMGSAKLCFPDDQREDLALRLLLLRRVGQEHDFGFQFSHIFFGGTSNKVISGFQQMTRSLIIPFVRDYKLFVFARGKPETELTRSLANRILIVHGHDGEARETVARFLGNIGFEPIILHEQANRGQTIIEKIEANSDVGFAVVLLTPDDQGRGKNETDLEPRARQNVLLELGYFMARLGRSHVCALKRGTVNIPSDFAGVVWEEMDDAGGWKQKLARELQAAGHTLDWKKVMK